MKEEPIIKCPKCGASMVRIISEVGKISFRGEGWTPKFFK